MKLFYTLYRAYLYWRIDRAGFRVKYTKRIEALNDYGLPYKEFGGACFKEGRIIYVKIGFNLCEECEVLAHELDHALGREDEHGKAVGNCGGTVYARIS